MKNLKAILFASILLVFTLNSCTKQPGTPIDIKSGTASSFITLKVDGVSKSAGSQFATIYSSGNTLQIIGQLPGTEGINIMISDVKVGVFDIVASSAILSYSLDTTYANSYLAVSGTLTITSLTSDTVTGTFQFVGNANGSTTAIKTITEGTFKSKYIKI